MNETNEMRRYIVSKSNDLIRKSRSNLTLIEKRILAFVISKIEPNDKSFKEITFAVQNFCNVFNLDQDKYYTQLRKITLKLMSKSFEIEKGNKIIQYVWFQKCAYNIDEGTITIKFNEELRPYLLDLREFLSYKIYYILAFKCKYSLDLYELLKSWINAKKILEIPIDDLKKHLYAEKYNNFKDFRKWVLEPALNDLNSYSDIDVSYETVTKGRKVTHIIFNFKQNEVEKQLHVFENIKAVLKD